MPESTPLPFAGKTALLFEDEELGTFRRDLESLGFKVLGYDSYPEIAEKIAKNEFPKVDLIVSDNYMYYDDGLSSAEMLDELGEMKKDRRNVNHDTPVLFITDSTRSTNRMVSAIKNGFSGFIWKSQRLRDLKAEGDEAIRRWHDNPLLVLPPAQAVIKAVMESPREGTLYITPEWKSTTFDILDGDEAYFDPAEFDPRFYKPDEIKDEISKYRDRDKITREEGELLRTGLVVPEMMSVSEIAPQRKLVKTV